MVFVKNEIPHELPKSSRTSCLSEEEVWRRDNSRMGKGSRKNLEKQANTVRLTPYSELSINIVWGHEEMWNVLPK